MRLWRAVRRGILIIILVLPTGALGTVIALGWTAPGRKFTAKLATKLITERVAGVISIGAIDGNLINHIILHDVSIHDSLGTAVIVANRIEAYYDVLKLIGGSELAFHSVVLDTASLHIVQSGRGELWNYQKVFHGTQSKPNAKQAKPTPLIALTDLTVRHTSLRVDVPATIRPPNKPSSRNAVPPAQPRIEPGPTGPLRVYTAENLDAVFDMLRISTPKNDPLLVKIHALSATLTDPAITISALQGEILQAADSLRFTFKRAALPNSVLRGGGAVRWPKGPPLFDFALTADTVDLKDLWWISRDFPDWQGRGHVIATSQDGSRTSYKLEQLKLGDKSGSAVGALTAVVDTLHGLGFKDLNLALTNVPLSVMKPYLDTLPFAGTLDGRLTADGFFDSMHLGGDLNFTDALVNGSPRSHFVFDGAMQFGGPQGAVFDQFRFDESAFAMGTINRMVPSVILPGQLALSGRLDGAWNNVKFTGTTEHIAPDQSRSRLLGAVALDTRDSVLGIDVDGNFDQLSFDALRSAYPKITARGGLSGHFAAKGKIDSLAVDAALSGDIGALRAAGNFRIFADGFGSDSLLLEFQRIDTEALLGEWSSTAFNGHAWMRGRVDSTGTPRGIVDMTIDPSRIGPVSFDGALVNLHAADGLVVIDTLQADLPEGWIDATGSLGLEHTHAGTISIDAGFRSLTPFDSLARSYFNIAPDSVVSKPLSGTVHATFNVSGSLGNISIDGLAQARHVVLDQYHITGIAADIKADSMGSRGLVLSIDADSAGHGVQTVERAQIGLSGRLDSLRYAINAQVYNSRLATLGTFQTRDSSALIRIDTLALSNPRQKWRMIAPTHLSWSDSRPILSDTLKLQANDGSGQVTAFGALPGAKPGVFTFDAVGLDLNDWVSLVQRDSATVGGILSTNLHLGGTANSPSILGSASVTGPTLDGVKIPLINATFDYGNKLLKSEVKFWKTGNPLLSANLSLPLDLAFSVTGDRQIPGALDITANADSADLALLEAFTTSVRGAAGMLNFSMHATGSWKAPKLDGAAKIVDGAFFLPDLGVRYTDVDGVFRFAGDSLVVDSLQVHSGGGGADLSGFIRFEQLTKPSLGLDAHFSDFLAVDAPGNMTIRPTGTLSLRGPLSQPVLTGRVGLSRSVYYYADLVNKTPIDLEDPLFADLVDTALVRRKGIGATFQNRFLNSLKIDNLKLGLNEEVALRSTEANIFISTDNTDMTINKTGKDYSPQGTVNAVRGTYIYSYRNIVNKEFTIQRGQVAFQGNGLDAGLDLEAVHTVHTDEDGDVDISAKITGTMQTPILKLTSAGHNFADIDLISLLIFGQRAYRVQVNQKAAELLASAAATSFVSTTLNQALVSRLSGGIGVQFHGLFDPQTGLSVSQQVGPRVSLVLDVGYCKTSGIKTAGASIEYRLSRSVNLKTSFEPVESCLSNRTSDLLRQPTLYQFGGGLYWKRDY